MPPARAAYLKQWILEGTPEDTPGKNGVGTEPEPDLSVAPADPPGPVVDAPAGAPGFAADIAPLFRDTDQISMMDSFDLTSVDDVRAHAQDILDAVATEFMPATGHGLRSGWRCCGGGSRAACCREW